MIPQSKLKDIKPGMRLYRVIKPPGVSPEMPRCVDAPVEKILDGVYLMFPEGQREITGYSMTATSGWVERMLSLSEKDAWEQYQRSCKGRIAKVKQSLARAEFELGYVTALIEERFK